MATDARSDARSDATARSARLPRHGCHATVLVFFLRKTILHSAYFEVFLFQLAAALNSGESSTLNLVRCGVLWLEATTRKPLALDF